MTKFWLAAILAATLSHNALATEEESMDFILMEEESSQSNNSQNCLTEEFADENASMGEECANLADEQDDNSDGESQDDFME